MPDITAVAAFITSIKNATDMAKAIREAGVTLEKAETRLKMAELIEALAEAKIQAADIQELLREKNRRIAELEKALKLNTNLVRSGDAYYESDENENPIGDPYCSYCWERNHITVHLSSTRMHKLCPNCQNVYERNRTPNKTKSPALPTGDTT